MKLTLLGTGTPTPSLKRTSASYLLEINDDVILFDTGPGAYMRLLQAGKRPSDVTHIFYSHFHYDHCADFAAIALTRWDHGAGAILPLKIIGPRHVHEFVDKLIGREGAFWPDIESRIKHETSVFYHKARGGKIPREPVLYEVTELKKYGVIEEDSWKLSCVEVPHFQPYLHCLGFRLDANGKSFCYSGDSAPSGAFSKMSKNCDIMVHMCHRISGTELTPAAKTSSSGHMEVARVAEDANAKVCVFSHISDQMDVPGVPERLLREISEVYKGNSIWAKDLMALEFEGIKAKELI